MMDTTENTLPNLFFQLGLSDQPDEIEAFIKAHPLEEGVEIENADFWSEGQSQFLKESREFDAAWAESVDELNALLHEQA
jgi:hypothetical protein